ncbi:MAG: archaeosortase/exosortase family protein [Deltaproteobacteria bacterium]|nr:archaeosortase/exosortase family protein [Deltaproteobacteria bacterium]
MGPRVTAAVVAVQAASLWAAWARCAVRYDDEQAVLAWLCLGTLFTLALRRTAPPPPTRPLLLPALLVGAFALTWGRVPGIASCALASTSLACTVSALRDGRRASAGLVLLALCALPWLATADFLVGWPLRVVAARAAAVLAGFAGDAVVLEGTCLRGAAGTACVDAPCAGLRMMGLTAWLVALMAARGGWGWGRTGLVGAGALLIVVGGNALRASALFMAETRGSVPSWVHQSVGLVVFAVVLGAVAWVGKGGAACGMSPDSRQPA